MKIRLSAHLENYITINMIKNLLLIIFISLFFKSLCTASDFRDSEWGMSKEQIELLEKTQPVYPEKDTLTYIGKVADLQVNIIYKFTDNKLKVGTYKFITKYANNNVYLRDYEKINDFLDLKYGKPEIRKETWNNESYKDRKGYYGNAVSIGYYVLESKWSNGKTIIIHQLSGSNNIIDHSIDYFDKNSTVDKREGKEINEIKGL